ncbi:MAG: hypothetical protein RMK19_00300 [Bacteroidia bacterium]|nr:hypothetical protein [Bacteroidia bacterium]MDW8014437.1 hypothetical protein [Bacteroidia bacterium]
MKRVLFLSLWANLLLAQPPNDNCANALQLSIGSCRNGQTTQNATAQGGEPTACFGTVGQSVWYWFQAGATDSVLRLEIDVTNLPNCTGTLAIYGPYNSAPNCMPTNAQAIHCDIDFLGTAVSGNNTSHYVDVRVQPNRYYMVQVRGFNCPGPGDRYLNFNICLRRACNHCGNLCLTNLCNWPSNSTAGLTFAWLDANCGSIYFSPYADQFSEVQFCMSFTAVNTTMWHNGGHENYCGGGGNLTSLTWWLYNSSCGLISGPTDFFSSNQMTGLTPGQTYILCYRAELACPHVRFIPFTYAAPLPVTLVEYTARCMGEAVEIRWTTAVEEGVESFRVERSLNRQTWEVVAEQAPYEHSGPKTYRVYDLHPTGKVIYYRLVERTTSGSEKEIALMEVNGCGRLRPELQWRQDPPRLTFTPEVGGNYRLVVYSVAGHLLLDLPFSAEGGETQTFPLPIKKGVYLVLLYAPTGEVFQERIAHW